MQITVAHILAEKDERIAFLHPSQLIGEALEMLEFEDVGALVVSKRGTKVDGILSERDVVRGLRYYGPEIFDRTVADLMTIDVHTCAVSMPRGEAAALMHEKAIRHLPVVDAGKFVGMISLHDVTPVEDADLLRVTSSTGPRRPSCEPDSGRVSN